MYYEQTSLTENHRHIEKFIHILYVILPTRLRIENSKMKDKSINTRIYLS